MPLPEALRGVKEATEPTESSLRCAGAALNNPQASRGEAEEVLMKLGSWLAPGVKAQTMTLVAASPVPAAVVHTVRRFKSEPLSAALACITASRLAGSAEVAAACVRAGAIDEALGLMDLYPGHGGVQNVCLMVLGVVLKEKDTARQALSMGAVSRVLRAMESTEGREVQNNGLAALRLLTDTGRGPRGGLHDAAARAKEEVQEAAMRSKASHQNDEVVQKAANDVLALVTPRFKEVLCWHWQSGWCKLGPRCTYAHGPNDLRVG